MISTLLFFSTFQVTISQELFSKEVNFTNLLMPKFLGIFSSMTLERISGERNYECYYIIFHIEDGEIASVEFSDNIHPRYLEKYNETYLEDVRERISKENIRFERNCKIFVPVIKHWREPTEHDNKLEEILDLLFPVNQTLDCVHFAEPLVIETWNVS